MTHVSVTIITRDEAVNINVIRSRAVRTESFDSTFGSEFYGFLRRLVDDDWVAKRTWGRRCEHIQPARRNDRRSKCAIAGINDVNGHR